MKYLGYSVIEVLLATAIFVTVSIGVFAMINSSQRVNKTTTIRDEARELVVEAKQALHYLEKYDFQAIENHVGKSSHNVVRYNGQWKLESVSYTEDDIFRRFIDIETVSDEDFLKKASIRVEYLLSGSDDIGIVKGEQYLLNLSQGSQSGVTRESANYQISNDSIGIPQGTIKRKTN